MTQAYFEPLGHGDGWENFRATEHTVSAWGPDLQHGAPPSALLTRAMDRLDPAGKTRLARIAVDLLGPVPLGELRTRARVARPGRRIQLLEGELEANGRTVARASAWMMRTQDTAAVEQTADQPLVLPTQDLDSSFFTRWTSGYIVSLDIRGDAQGVVWARPRLPLVADETMTRAERVMCVADIANGGPSKMGGSITAALYLERFVPEGQKWAHLDTFAWNEADAPGHPVGGEAQGLRSAFAMLRARYGA